MEVTLPQTFAKAHMLTPMVMDIIVYEPWPAGHAWAKPKKGKFSAEEIATAKSHPSWLGTQAFTDAEWLEVRRRPRAEVRPEWFAVLGQEGNEDPETLYMILHRAYEAEMALYTTMGVEPDFLSVYHVLAALFALRGYVLNRKREWDFPKYLPQNICDLLPKDLAGPEGA